MNLNLYKAVAPRDPKTGEIAGMKKPNLEKYSFLVALTITTGLTIWAVWRILQ